LSWSFSKRVFPTATASQQTSAAISSLMAAMSFFVVKCKALFAAGSTEQLNVPLPL